LKKAKNIKFYANLISAITNLVCLIEQNIIFLSYRCNHRHAFEKVQTLLWNIVGIAHPFHAFEATTT